MMPVHKIQIILIDPDKHIFEFVKNSLKPLQAEFHFFTSALEGLRRAEELAPGLIFLDMVQGEMDGVEACISLRALPELKDTLIVFFTGRNEDYSQIAGFNAGADDYILKPCKPQIFLSRIRALLKRIKSDSLTPAATDPDIVIDREKYIVRKGLLEFLLPQKEFELLSLLLNTPRKVFTRKEIYSQVWNGEMASGNRTIDVHIRKIREKIGDNHIKTVKGVGYRFEYPEKAKGY